MTWWLEVAPVIIGVVLLLATWRRFPLTPLLCRLLFVHACILMLGGHYTYAQVPLGFWFQDLFDLGRNHRSEEHTSELQSLMRISYAVFCLKKKTKILKRKQNQLIRNSATATQTKPTKKAIR